MPASGRRQNKASEFTLTPEQVQGMIHARIPTLRTRPEGIEFRDRVLLEVLAWLALRRQEAADLHWKHFDLDADPATVTVHGKGDKERVLRFGRIYPALVSDLRHLRGSRRFGPVFESLQRGTDGRPQPITAKRVEQTVIGAAQAAGVDSPNPRRKNVTPHLLRHTWARHALDRGVDMRVVQHWLGHESYATTADVYGTPSLEYCESELVEKLGRP